MAGFIGIDITGVETIKQRLLKLPKEAMDAGVETANKYIVDAMQIYPPKPTGKFQWSSDKQRRFVMAKMREEGFPGRNQNLRKEWKTVGSGYKQIVANEAPYSEFVQGDNQIIGHKANGWQTAGQVIKAKASEILRKFEAGVKNAIKKLHLN